MNEPATLYIQNGRNSSKFKGCSPLQQCNGLISLKPENRLLSIYETLGIMLSKKRASLIVLLILQLMSSLGQGSELPDSSFVWTIRNISMGQCMSTSSYMLLGDTVINDKEYQQIHVTLDSIFSEGNSSYFCSSRDSSGLWYFIPDGDSIEYLLYDFNASVGEKITLNNPWAVGEVDAYVTSKDSILIDGAYKSRLGIGARPNEFWEYWIEDVGCLGGLFYSCFFIFDTGFELTCTYLYDEFQYNLGYHEYCGCFKSTSVITKSIGPDVSIFPNPSSGLLSIQNKTEEPVRIYFYSSEGRIIELVELPNNSRKSIEMNHQGAVFVNIVGENINKTQQIQVVK